MVGRALANVCRHEDVLGKIAPDCFALLMPHTGKVAGQRAIDRFEQVVKESLPPHLGTLDVAYSVRQLSRQPNEESQ